MTALNKVELKERERKTWSSAADGWRRRDDLMRKGTAPVTDRMLELACLASGGRLLDIASGTGEPAISAAQIVGNEGQVIGLDLVDDMLCVARDKADQAGLRNIEFRCEDAEQFNMAAGDFDAVTIRWGLMFMPEPGVCLQRAHNVLRKDGRIVIACWAVPERNPFISLLMQVLDNYIEIPTPPPGTPGIFSLADPDRLHDLIVSAGFKNFEIEELEIDALEIEDGKAYWDTMSDLAAPVMVLIEQLANYERERYICEVIEKANAFKTGDTLIMKGSTWIASAVR